MNMQQTRRGWALGTLGTLAVSLGGWAGAATAAEPTFPERTVRIVVPFTAGGSSDVQARMLADRLGRLWGQSVVVENKPGAGGHLGGKYVVDQPADGYTLMVGSIGLHATYGIYKKLSYNPATDLRVITVLAEMPHVVVAPPTFAAKDLRQLTDMAKKAPGTINFGSAGVGSSVHMMGELYKLQSGAPLVHVPYRGSSQALPDLIAGSVSFMFDSVAASQPFIKTGQLRALAVTTSKRVPIYPDLPTVEEAGVKGYNADNWFGVYAPKGTPVDIQKRLADALQKSMAEPVLAENLLQKGFVISFDNSQRLAALTASDRAKWGAVIKTANVSL